MTAKLRKIPLKKTNIELRQADGTKRTEAFDYREHLIGALNSPHIDEHTGQPRGLGPVEMRRRISIIKQIDASKDDYVLLDNADYGELRSCVNNQKWLLVDEAITQFSDDIDKAEEVDVEQKQST